MIHEQSVTIFCITNGIKNTIFKSYQERHDIVFKFTKNSSDLTCKKKMIEYILILTEIGRQVILPSYGMIKN